MCVKKMAAEVVSYGMISLTSLIAGVILAVILYIGLKSKKEETSDSNRSDLDEKPSIIGEKKDILKQVKGKKKAGTLAAKTHHRQFAVLKGHTGHVCDLEYSLNGKYLASTSQGYLLVLVKYNSLFENCAFNCAILSFSQRRLPRYKQFIIYKEKTALFAWRITVESDEI